MMAVGGAWTAIVTPFDEDRALDRKGLDRNIEFQISEGISGLVPVGTTGESPTLSWDEHNEVIDRALSHCKGGCGILAGTGSNSTAEAIQSARHAARSGARGVLMVDCYYNGPSSQELRDEYYAVVARELPEVAVVPYVIPGRTGTALAVEDLAILADRFPNVNTVKEATGDLERMAETRRLLGNDFSIMSGDDDITFRMLSDPRIRGNGVISVISNVAPGAVARMVSLALDGNFQEAGRLQEALAPLFGVVTVRVDNQRVLPSGEVVTVSDRYRNPLAVKTLMAGLGMPAGPCRQPLGRMSAAGVERVRAAARQVWERSPEVLEPAGRFYGIDVAARLADDSVWNALAG